MSEKQTDQRRMMAQAWHEAHKRSVLKSKARRADKPSVKDRCGRCGGPLLEERGITRCNSCGYNPGCTLGFEQERLHPTAPEDRLPLDRAFRDGTILEEELNFDDE